MQASAPKNVDPLDLAASWKGRDPGLGTLPTSPQAQRASGASFAGAFDMEDAGKEYLATYSPSGLAAVMPAGWKGVEGGANAHHPSSALSSSGDPFSEFSRYSVSPQAVARSENLRGVMRLSENTRQGQGRTLGYQSLLRNYVTPIGPQPIGDKAMLWNDSSSRQAYIASSTGKFPELDAC